MRILLFTDNHFCETSSVIRSHGKKYTTRIENQLESINWLERLAEQEKCEAVICAGDFFDKANLTDMELTALKEINWSNITHYFLVGNHESSVNGLAFNSTKALEGLNRIIVSEPTVWKYDNNENDICFLPYVIESDRKPIFEYFGKPLGNRVIISHNDIKGVQMGPVISQTGFDIKDIQTNCKLFINGHLHNGQAVATGIINLGNLTGQNYGENATKYAHNVMLLDTDTMTYRLIENPYAFNFYKLDIESETDFDILNALKTNAVLSLKCKEKLVKLLKEKLESIKSNVIETRIIISKEFDDSSAEADISDLTVDHIAKFIECARNTYGSDKILEEELSEICK